MQENTQPQDENRLIAERRARLADLRAQGQAFPNDFRRTHFAGDLQKDFGDREKEALAELDLQVSVAGRVMLNRGAFIVIQDMTGRIQLYVDRRGLSEDVLAEIRQWDLGDIIAAEGMLAKSGKGDLYVHMQSARRLTKSLRPLPEKHKGLQDTEMRYRQRYLDLITNEDARAVFAKRTAIIESIRRFLQAERFVEAETPMLQVLAGGAAARPFVTHHNALDIDMYLRIAPELYLKRLVVGGFERVFEINRNFRNEGLSTRHNPEFTMLEFYQAYADYQDLMDLTESMLGAVASEVLGTTKFSSQGVEYDFAKPFERLSLFDAVLRFNPDISASALSSDKDIADICERMDIPVREGWGLGKKQLEIFEKTVEHKLIQPTFITGYPAEVSPLARRSDENPFLTERFELIVGGREIANGFSELNDPEDQAERFRQQMAEKAAGDDEAMPYDHDYIRALEYGMPPTAGEGIGIDRLVMLLCDQASIRDVILFPHMRPEQARGVV
jgi:lysyl-tRNA synthetase class 2